MNKRDKKGRKGEEEGAIFHERANIDPTFRLGLEFNDDLSDTTSVLSSVLGIFAMYFKMRVFAWQAVVLAVISVANSRGEISGEAPRNMWTTFGVALTSLLLSYISAYQMQTL
eukprot:TRINITY_DN4748_c0_g1_i1.p1 TRINITY_DN4748_c0_g1~~TRINITY_DN4748_c0_g1_i1.p1  ORF type:complete len:113 (+),score=19.90 TRINITY_DN4748_c0_g1_i1:97-435(+)